MATEPVLCVPAVDPHLDYQAWIRLQREVGKCLCGAVPGSDSYCPMEAWMLMYHRPDGKAAFKNRQTRQYMYL
jgi:hypothetical protein